MHSLPQLVPRGLQNPSQQAMLNGEVHDWYRFRLGFSDHLVSDLLAELGATKRSRILDPFCGTGTVLVECMKQGVDCVGIDANPATFFAAQVKTTWNLEPDRVLELLDDVENSCERHLSVSTLASDPTFRYLEDAGFLGRGGSKSSRCWRHLRSRGPFGHCIVRKNTDGCCCSHCWQPWSRTVQT